MTEEEGKTLNILEARVIQIALSYKAMKAKCEELARKVEEKNAAIETLQAQISALQADCANLKTAKALSLSDTDAKSAKDTIAKLVREVNKCLALLNA